VSPASTTLTTAVRRTRRLLRPPLSGDGLLLVGFVEGLVGWPLSWLVANRPGLSPFGLFESVVGLWAVLTLAIVAVGWFGTAPTVRSNDAWVVWGVLNLIATGVNVLGVLDVTGVLDTLPATLVRYAFFHPWLAVFGGGYLITALLNRGSRGVRRVERAVYAGGGVVSLLVLAVAFAGGESSALPVEYAFLVGAVLHLVPIGFDLWYDALR
jgi:hypothetical protein